MRNLFKIYLLTAAMIFPSLSYSQTKQDKKDMATDSLKIASIAKDSVNTKKGTQTAPKAAADNQDTVKQKKFFNALDYTLQKRYRPKKYEFKNKNFFDNTYISYSVGVEGFFNRVVNSPITANTLFGLSLGKNFSAAHGLRLNLNAGWAYNQLIDEKHVRAGAGLDYMFNVSSYILGYDPSRRIEFIPFFGAGYNYSKTESSAFHVAEIHGGMQFKLHLYHNIDVFVEPKITLYTDGIDHYTVENWHAYDFGYGGMLGMTYRFDDSRRQFKKDQEYNKEKSLFISLEGGAQYQFSDMTREIGLMKTIGPHSQLSVGKYLSSVMAFRIGAFYSFDQWSSKITDKNETRTDYNTTYMGGRAELMFNPLGYLNRPWTEVFSLYLTGGIEVGSMKKEDIFADVKSTYLGFTAGLQGKYKFNQHWSLFLEPRVSIVPYTHIPVNAEGEVMDRRKKFRDNIYNFNIGVQYDF